MSPSPVQPFHVTNHSSYQSSADKCSEIGKLSLITYNVKNLKSNYVCINNLLNSHDFILIQEHWLFKFEEKLFSQFNSNIAYHAKYVDDSDPIPPIQKPRGFAGTAILWKKNSEYKVTKLPDGDHRITCIEIDTNPTPVLLLCVYMPSKGSKIRDNAYDETLDQIGHIIVKYTSSHNIICAGDWNATLLQASTQDARDRKLKEFLYEYNLTLAEYGSHASFTAPYGNSQIDYFLVDDNMKNHIVCSKLLSTLHDDTSDHFPVLLTIEIQSNATNTRNHD